MAETSAGYFPADVADDQVGSGSPGRLESTDIETAWAGREVRRAHFPLGGYRAFNGQTSPLNQTDAHTLRAFMRARRGKLEAFYFFPPHREFFQLQDTGQVGDGSSIAFTIPFKGGTYTTFYQATPPDFLDATPLDIPYVMSTDGSADNSDRVQFPTAPDLDLAILFDGFARERWLVRSDLDVYESPLLLTADDRTVWPVKVKEVR